ncbi:hypothetical protein V2J09_009364 [Rumex salicifolius]
MGICISCDGGFIQDEEAAHVGLEYRNDVVLYVSDIKHGGDGSPPLAVGSLTSQQGSKGLNQDSAILHQGFGGPNGAFCGVFDGHGKNGHFVSEMVRNRLPSLILNQKNALQGEGEDDVSRWKQFFTSAFNAMDKEMKLRESMDCSLSGTTAVVVVKQGEDLYIANLGDSRAVLGTRMTTEEGITAMQLTTDLKPGLPDEAERIRKSKGRVFALEAEPHVQRVWMPEDNYPGLAMSRSFGDLDLKQHGVISTPLVTHHRLSPQDRFLVLATDGVWDVMSSDEVATTVWGASNQAEAAQELVVKARKAWVRKFPSAKIDDCTALCLFFHAREILD